MRSSLYACWRWGAVQCGTSGLVELEVSRTALTLPQRSATVDPDQARCICRNQPDLLRSSLVEAGAHVVVAGVDAIAWKGSRC